MFLKAVISALLNRKMPTDLSHIRALKVLGGGFLGKGKSVQLQDAIQNNEVLIVLICYCHDSICYNQKIIYTSHIIYYIYICIVTGCVLFISECLIVKIEGTNPEVPSCAEVPGREAVGDLRNPLSIAADDAPMTVHYVWV